MDEGKIKFYYGKGHGKSTAAIGNAILRASQGDEAIIIQFLKGKDERAESFFKRLEPEIKLFRFAKCQEGFESLDPKQKEDEILSLKNGFNYGKKVIATGVCDVVILDEIFGLVDLGVISADELWQMLSAKPDDMEVILTGRTLQDGLRGLADEIYHIEAEK
ncbi:MAG: cob(I)yrinic acid a,c-diamide adenosyltransferase [Clostridiales bacterium]|nr:cob(I)yrinic acid a,c-diamide adenosyltransferase [Clostridiales bacterium]